LVTSVYFIALRKSPILRNQTFNVNNDLTRIHFISLGHQYPSHRRYEMNLSFSLPLRNPPKLSKVHQHKTIQNKVAEAKKS